MVQARACKAPYAGSIPAAASTVSPGSCVTNPGTAGGAGPAGYPAAVATDDRRVEPTKPSRTARAVARAEAVTARLEAGRRTGFVVAATKRFFEIGGLDLSALLGIELFTTIIPLVLIGFGWVSDFSPSVSVGDVIIRHFGLHGAEATAMRSAFTSSQSLESVWTFFGMLSFLVWGIPMSIQVAKTYALAWNRERFGLVQEALRGIAWFLVYLGVLMVDEALAYSKTGAGMHVVDLLVGMLVGFALWAIAPVILVRNGGRGWRYLWINGLAGMLIDTLIMRGVGRLIMPGLLLGWEAFGPIGMAMGLMTWSIVTATAWVVTAVVGACLWERNTPIEVVVDAQLGDELEPVE